jgi:uncharacterized membrane protein (UPF0127 family)
MFIKKNPFLILLILIVLVIITIVASSNLINKTDNSNQNNIPVKKDYIFVGDKKLFIEIADTDIERKQGLSGREYLEENHGMLFVFNEKSQKAFWMKDMNFAIDIIWIEDNKIVQIDKNVKPPEPNTPNNELKLYSSKLAINYVLEVKAGLSDEYNFKIGDTIDFSAI